MFTLPNQLQGHAIATADGQRRNQPSALPDPLGSALNAGVAFSSMLRYARGVQPEADVVRAAVLASSSSFESEARDDILQIYPEQATLDVRVVEDRRAYTRALEDLGIDIDGVEPVSLSFALFDTDVDLATAAADLMVPPLELEQNLGELSPALGALAGNRLDRAEFGALYRDALCILSVTSENRPSSCP